MTTKNTFFYGWIMLGVAIGLAIATMPSQTVVVSIFNDSFQNAASIKIEDLSLAYTVGTILAAFPLPWVGRMADVHGLRTVTAVVTICFVGALLLLTQASNIFQLGLCFFLIRFLGQGSLGMLAGHTIAMWFERKLGKTHSILAIVGFAGGSALMPRPTAWLIENHGYQTALLVLAGFVVLLVFPALLFVFKNKPEDIGQHLDGDPREHTAHDTVHGGNAPANDPAFTRKQAMRTSAYWILVPIMCANGLIGTALLFHMQEMLRSVGLEGTETQTATAIQPWPICFGLGMLVIGYLVDRFKPRHLMPFGPALMLVACIICLAPVAGWVSPDHAILTMAIGMGMFGFSMAVSVAVGNPAIARYFGRTHHGAIRGTISLASVAATGIGPYLAGKAFVLSGESYTPILIAFAVSGVPLAISSLFLRP
ncbi:MAG: MFS transporter, partial [Phycisphaerales bacterium]